MIMDPYFLLDIEDAAPSDIYIYIENWVITNYPKIDEDEIALVTNACYNIVKFYIKTVLPSAIDEYQTLMFIRSKN